MIKIPPCRPQFPERILSTWKGNHTVWDIGQNTGNALLLGHSIGEADVKITANSKP